MFLTDKWTSQMFFFSSNAYVSYESYQVLWFEGCMWNCIFFNAWINHSIKGSVFSENGFVYSSSNSTCELLCGLYFQTCCLSDTKNYKFKLLVKLCFILLVFFWHWNSMPLVRFKRYYHEHWFTYIVQININLWSKLYIILVFFIISDHYFTDESLYEQNWMPKSYQCRDSSWKSCLFVKWIGSRIWDYLFCFSIICSDNTN